MPTGAPAAEGAAGASRESECAGSGESIVARRKLKRN